MEVDPILSHLWLLTAFCLSSALRLWLLCLSAVPCCILSCSTSFLPQPVSVKNSPTALLQPVVLPQGLLPLRGQQMLFLEGCCLSWPLSPLQAYPCMPWKTKTHTLKLARKDHSGHSSSGPNITAAEDKLTQKANPTASSHSKNGGVANVFAPVTAQSCHANGAWWTRPMAAIRLGHQGSVLPSGLGENSCTDF